MGFLRFMASPLGRLLRILLGAALIVWGYLMHSTAGYVLLAVGFVPLAAGLFDWCFFAPIFGLPLQGAAIRRKG
ncbi:MAG TPA: YgaP-like transmembrane domain [Candidatus Tyrphobacter sp.]